jgi:manganese-dependent inorganic pyrophosphatase
VSHWTLGVSFQSAPYSADDGGGVGFGLYLGICNSQGHDLAVSQVTCLDSASMLSRKEELLKQMMAISYKSDVSLVILMLTDVLLEGSYLLFVGDDDIISQAFDVSPKDNEVFLPEVMSRKKQVIPSLSALWG